MRHCPTLLMPRRSPCFGTTTTSTIDSCICSTKPITTRQPRETTIFPERTVHHVQRTIPPSLFDSFSTEEIGTSEPRGRRFDRQLLQPFVWWCDAGGARGWWRRGHCARSDTAKPFRRNPNRESARGMVSASVAVFCANGVFVTRSNRTNRSRTVIPRRCAISNLARRSDAELPPAPPPSLPTNRC